MEVSVRRRFVGNAAGFGVVSLIAALAAGGCRPSEPAASELVLSNGKVFTAADESPWAEAVLIRGDRIAAVGTEAEVRAAAGPGAKIVDLGGRAVVPGFNDAHAHIAPLLSTVWVTAGSGPTPDPSFAELADSLRAAVARTPAGTTLSAMVGERVRDDPLARRAELDRIAPAHPVLLGTWTGQWTIYNSAGLSLAQTGDSVRDDLGGYIERDATGRPTGLFEEYANFSRWQVLRPHADSIVIGAFRQFGAAAIAFGITTVQDLSVSVPPAALARVVDSLTTLPYRLRVVPMPITSPAGRDLEPWRVLRAPAGGSVTVSGIKYVLDGTPVERYAAFREPYADRPDWSGRPNFPVDTVRAILREALTNDEQPLLHAAGDSTIALVLNLMAELAPDSVWRRLRPRIEHGDGLAPDQYPLARRFGLVFVQNPSHLALGPLALARWGPARMAALQPLRGVLSNDIPLAFGSDGPLNPFLNIMFAVTHPDNPAEALTIEEAVRAYTVGSAFAEMEERQKGRLAPGMLADLAVLSQDIFSIPVAQLPATRSVLTLVGGRAVHDPEGLLAEPASGIGAETD